MRPKPTTRIRPAFVTIGLWLLGGSCLFGVAAAGCTNNAASRQHLSASFDPTSALNRNATPTPTQIPRPTATSTQRATLVPTPVPTATPTPLWPTKSTVQNQLESLVAESSDLGDEVSVSITVSFGDEEVEASNGLDVFPSASAAKAWWVAIAVGEVGTKAVAPHATSIFTASDNDAAGEVIDLVGIDEINLVTRSWGMSDTYLASWTLLASPRLASDRSDDRRANRTTTRDAVRFLRKLAGGELLTPDDTTRVVTWMKLSPDDGSTDPYASVLVADLPKPIAAATAHKAGWLPPDCCDVGPEHEVIVSAGIVPCRATARLGGDESFEIAIAAMDANNYDAQVDWVSTASAAITQTLCPELQSGDRDDAYSDNQRRQ